MMTDKESISDSFSIGSEQLVDKQQDERTTPFEEIDPIELVAVKEEDPDNFEEQTRDIFEVEKIEYLAGKSAEREVNDGRRSENLTKENSKFQKTPDVEDVENNSGSSDEEDNSRDAESNPEEAAESNGGSDSIGKSPLAVDNPKTDSANGFRCEICSKTYSRRNKLNDHRLSVHEKLLCPVCGKNVGRKYYTRHVKIHTKVPAVGSFPCSECSNIYPSPEKLDSHIKRVHDKDAKKVCSYCGKSYSMFYLPIHLRQHTADCNMQYSCEVCHKEFKNLSSLEGHRRIHTLPKRYTCDICNASFHFSNALKTHIQRHMGYKPFKCKVCDKCFTDESYLRHHEQRHEGEKPFECPECSKSFSTLQDFRQHERRHRGEKPHKCGLCDDRRYRTSRQLQVHIRMAHTGERPFVCATCGQGFVEKRGVLMHVLTSGH